MQLLLCYMHMIMALIMRILQLQERKHSDMRELHMNLFAEKCFIRSISEECRYTIIEPVTFKPGWKSYITKAIKEAVNIPVISTNVIKKPEQAEQFLAEGVMDFAAVGRGMYADAEWTKKAYEGRSEDIKPCIGCLYCLDQTALFRRSTCAVNGTAVREKEFPPVKQDLKGKNIVVIGAGPSGMEAALVCAQRGAFVAVFEKSDHIGGSAELGTRTPDKEALKALVTYYEIQAQKQKIDMRFQTEATMEMIRECDPYAIFVGTGANPLIPTIDGIKDTKYMTIPEALDYDFKPEGKKIVVIGGGMTGSETAEHFAKMDYHINSMAVFYCHTKSRLVKDLQAWVVIYY